MAVEGKRGGPPLYIGLAGALLTIINIDACMCVNFD